MRRNLRFACYLPYDFLLWSWDCWWIIKLICIISNKQWHFHLLCILVYTPHRKVSLWHPELRIPKLADNLNCPSKNFIEVVFASYYNRLYLCCCLNIHCDILHMTCSSNSLYIYSMILFQIRLSLLIKLFVMRKK